MMRLPIQFAALGLVLMATSAIGQDLQGDPVRAREKIAMCVGCHGMPGYKATYPQVFSVPKIGGQNAKYIENALHEYQKGERIQPTMHGIAASLSEQDIADIAAYYSGLR